MKISLFFILLTVFINLSAEGAKILFFFGLSTPSHSFTVWPLVEKLADRGHNITFFQPFENKFPNPKIIEISPKLKDTVTPEQNLLTSRLAKGRLGIQIFTLTLPHMGVALCEEFLSLSSVMKWIKEVDGFDLIISDGLYNDCSLGLVHKFKAKHAIFGTTSAFGWWAESYGFHFESNWISDNHLSFPLPLTFFQRILTTLTPFYYYYQKRFIMYPKLEKLLREKLEMPDMPPLDEIDKNTSLVLMNTHFSEEVARSLPPLVVSVGGMHCKESTKPLPKDILKFIEDSGDKGVIYVSFGSVAQISKAPKELRNAVFEAFKNSKQRFLWKWESARPTDMPDNIFTASWMPQQEILAHPKTRAFITHGGLLGIQEAIYHGVPMISIPIFAEQDYNTDRLVRTGRGIQLDIIGLTRVQIEEAINKILNDESYRNSLRKASRQFKDRPEKPVDTAVWWTEFILRHEDPSFLRPLAQNQYWFQKRLLDVWVAIIGFFSVVLILLFLAIKKIFLLLLKSAFPNSKNIRKGKSDVQRKKDKKSD